MNQHRPVPGIARGPQNFAREARPPIPNPMMPNPLPVLGSAQQPTPEQVIAEQMQDLAMEIYCRLVSNHACVDSFRQVNADPELFRELAKASQAAAQAYFEALGIQFQQGEQPS